MPNITQTGPDLLPSGAIDQIAMPAKGLSTLIWQKYETGTFDDASTDHDIIVFEVFPGRSTSIEYRVTAHDDAGGRVATAISQQAIVSYGAGAFAFEFVDGAGTYDDGVAPVPLGAAPWNTLTATSVQIDATHAAVRVNNHTAGGSIRWSAWVGVYGAQAR